MSDEPLTAIAERMASVDPVPGAGPAAAWTCAFAAALVETVSGVMLRKDPDDPDATEQRRDRAAALRARAFALADEDMAAYSEVLAVLGRRDEPGHGPRLRAALSQATDPPLRIAELAAEVVRLAADAGLEARGGVRGEAIMAAVLAEAVVRASVHVIDLNLAGAPEDPRRRRVRDLVEGARADLARAGLDA